jgi:hypothetical protein
MLGALLQRMRTRAVWLRYVGTHRPFSIEGEELEIRAPANEQRFLSLRLAAAAGESQIEEIHPNRNTQEDAANSVQPVLFQLACRMNHPRQEKTDGQTEAADCDAPPRFRVELSIGYAHAFLLQSFVRYQSIIESLIAKNVNAIESRSQLHT